MNIFGIDISQIPWPMFLLLVFMVVGYILYTHVYLPLEERNKQLEKEFQSVRDKDQNNLEELKTQIQSLNTFVTTVKDTVEESALSKHRIEQMLHNVEKYADQLHHISMFLNNKELLIEDRVNDIKKQLVELTNYVDDIKDRLESKKSKW